MSRVGLMGAFVEVWSKLTSPPPVARLLIAAVLLAICLWLLLPNGSSIPRWRCSARS